MSMEKPFINEVNPSIEGLMDEMNRERYKG